MTTPIYTVDSIPATKPLPANAQCIVIVSRSLFSTRFGGARSTRTQIAALASLGYRVVAIHDDVASIQVAHELRVEHGAQFISIPAFFDLSMKRYASPVRLWEHFAARKRFHALMDQFRPVAIFVHGERPLRIYLSMQRKYRILYSLHDSGYASRGSISEQMNDMWLGSETLIRKSMLIFRRYIEFRRIRKFKHFVANSKYIANLYGHGHANILYPPIPMNGMLKGSSAKAVNAPIPPRKLKRILYVGRLEPAKGPQDAVAMLKSLPEEYELVLIGEGIFQKEYEDLSQTPEFRGRLGVLGQLPNAHVLRWMAASGVVFVPSHVDEAFGAVGLEGFAEGTPAVAYNVGGMGEWCCEPAGVLVPRGDIQAAIKAILEVTGDAGEWARRSEVARRMVEAKFGYNRFVSEMRQILRS